MDDFTFLTPQTASAQPGDPQSLQNALQRLTPQQRRMLFEPYQHELATYEQQMQPQQHRTALAAILGGIGNTMAGYQHAQALQRMQHGAQDVFGAVYGGDPRAAMVNALRQRQQPALEADPYAPPADYSEA